jgi:endonuclease G
LQGAVGKWTIKEGIMFKKSRVVFFAVICLIASTSYLYAGPLEDCAEYAKLGVPGQQGERLCRKGYLLSHSSENKTPYWVIEHLTAEKANANAVQRYNKFQPDPDIEKGRHAELSDYKGSGYDRGHMAPSADMKWDEQAMIECFYLSNMVPQVGKGMNQGIWKELEEKVRKWAIARGELFIFTGPVYDGGVKETIGKNKVAVPSHLYKIVYDPKEKEAIAFFMPNEPIKTSEMPLYMVTIRDLEEKTGLDFLSALDKQMQDSIETKKPAGLWK